MKKGMRAGLSGFAIVVIFTFGLPMKSADAVLNNGVCEGREVCFWMDSNFQGCSWDGVSQTGVGEDLRKLRYTTCPDVSLNDNISSYRNLSLEWEVLWADAGKGDTYCIAPRGASGNVQRAFNDKATSMISIEEAQYDRKACKYNDAD